MTHKLLILPGDGIGPEIIGAAVQVLEVLVREHGLDLEWEEGLLGGCAVDAKGKPLPDETLASARSADAILLGAVGGPQYDKLDRPLRPERGLLALRQELELFANLRP
ncbi:MAG: 3-isopropylmalate dehydrogenase, partial [Candidatus Competibacteraceae bacterium]|nr:3-isopropylmalate dehydrogenase [Candidatus Competibacteraceae bacterium]